MTLSSLSIWYLWILIKEIKMLCLFLPTTKAYVEFIHREKARIYLQCIYCKVKPRIQREMSHTTDPKRNESYNQIRMCMCMDIWWIYGG
jgi:hypothetical protein